jgi:hypothetical protein
MFLALQSRLHLQDSALNRKVTPGFTGMTMMGRYLLSFKTKPQPPHQPLRQSLK